MFTQTILTIFLGIIAGTFTGLIPGIHINLISSLIVTLIKTPTNSIIVFIISLSITHTFLDSIPSIFFGAPNQSMIQTALPGHKFFLEGKAHYAVLLTIIGSALSIIFAIILTPFLIIIFKKIYPLINNYIPHIIILIISIIILKGKNKIKSLAIFILSGLLGLFLFSIPLKNILLPTFTGLFGVSGLIISLKEESIFKKQEIIRPPKIKDHIIPCFIATLIASLAALLPGLGSSHSAILTLIILKNLNQEHFLSISGTINTANMAISAITYYTLQKARNGSIIAISNYFPTISFENFLIIFTTIALTASIAIILSLKITTVFTILINKINYKKIILIIIVIVTFVCLITTGVIGLIILLTTTLYGIIVVENNIARNNLLGILIIPTLIYLI